MRRSRNVDFSTLRQTFLVAGVATFLVIRAQLWLTHYPQLGGHGLHIAHLLYGGGWADDAGGVLRRVGRTVGAAGC